jgi:hypothetical protein
VSGGGVECPSFCQQSSVQVEFEAGAFEAPVDIRVLGATLLLADAEKVVDEIDVRSPTVFAEGGRYVAWDGELAPNAAIDTSHELVGPNWSSVAGATAGSRSGFDTYGMSFLLDLTVEIDGHVRILRSGPISRAPIIDT